MSILDLIEEDALLANISSYQTNGSTINGEFINAINSGTPVQINDTKLQQISDTVESERRTKSPIVFFFPIICVIAVIFLFKVVLSQTMQGGINPVVLISIIIAVSVMALFFFMLFMSKGREKKKSDKEAIQHAFQNNCFTMMNYTITDKRKYHTTTRGASDDTYVHRYFYIYSEELIIRVDYDIYTRTSIGDTITAAILNDNGTEYFLLV